MIRRSSSSGPGKRLLISLVGASLAITALPLTAATAIAAATTEYASTQTIPVPPASNYQGSAGGDGWAVALSANAVYNIFHHQSSVQVACHLQVDARECWAPRTVRDQDGNDFAAPGHPGVWLDQGSGALYTYTTRYSDNTVGVLCADTTAQSEADMFCGYTPLTSPQEGGAPSNPVFVGTRWYSFNYLSGQDDVGESNRLLCFDTATKAACAGGARLATAPGEGPTSSSSFQPPAIAAIGTRIVIPMQRHSDHVLACFETASQSPCGGAWPAAAPSGWGSAFPELSADGEVRGLCLPTSSGPCFDLAGAEVPMPASLQAVLGGNSGWNGPAEIVGSRVYIPNGNYNRVECYDYSAGAGCANFPRQFNDLYLLYTVNADPQRPDCLWVNADYGTQIQNFDAYSGGACGEGPIRVLASRIVVPTVECQPTSYRELQVLAPARSSYGSGSVSFLDGNAQPIDGIAPRSLDADGAVSLVGLGLNTAAGLPQFLISLDGAEGDPGEVQVRLSWTASKDPSCRPPGAVTLTPTWAAAGSLMTIRFSCATAPTTGIQPLGGTAPTTPDLGIKVTGNGRDYSQSVRIPDPGRYIATMECGGVLATSYPVTVRESVPNTFGAGWPYSGEFTLYYEYKAPHRYLGNAVAGADNWSATDTPVNIKPWPGVPHALHLSFYDYYSEDDAYGFAMWTNDCRDEGGLGWGCTYSRNAIALNQRYLDPESDAHRTKVATHELGHTLALRHPVDAGLSCKTILSVMCSGKIGYSTPQPYDTDRLNGLYK